MKKIVVFLVVFMSFGINVFAVTDYEQEYIDNIINEYQYDNYVFYNYSFDGDDKGMRAICFNGDADVFLTYTSKDDDSVLFELFSDVSVDWRYCYGYSSNVTKTSTDFNSGWGICDVFYSTANFYEDDVLIFEGKKKLKQLVAKASLDKVLGLILTLVSSLTALIVLLISFRKVWNFLRSFLIGA